MVQGRSTTKQHKTTWTSTADLIITPNTHEPIVSRELFDLAQSKKSNPIKAAAETGTNIFSKKLYCGHCGYAIHYERRKSRKDTYYSCRARKQHGKAVCVSTPVSISGDLLKQRILEVLRMQAAVFADKRERQSATANSAANAEIQAQLTQLQQELGRTSGFLKGLYESLIEGDITNAEYGEMKQNYENRIATLTEREAKLRDEIRKSCLRDSELAKARENLAQINVISELTADVVDTLIEKILLFEDKHIEVAFKFMDETGNTKEEGEADE
jgi:hypothetical protein